MTEIVKIEELNTFLPLASLEALPVEEQKMRLQYWKEHFSIKEILEGLGTYKNKLYDLYKKHEITTQGHMQAKRKGKEKTTPKEDTPNTLEYGVCVAMEQNHATSISGHYSCIKKEDSSMQKIFLFKNACKYYL
ncbi:hypothetical protein ACT7C8_17240 [Bacillus cereus]